MERLQRIMIGNGLLVVLASMFAGFMLMFGLLGGLEVWPGTIIHIPTYGTTEGFLEHFGFQNIKDLPGLDELKAAGLLEGQVRTDLLPLSHREPEDPLEDGDDGSLSFLTAEQAEADDDKTAPSAEIIDIQG